MKSVNKNAGIRNVIMLTGAFCAYYMGAAFSSGRELLQFFAGYGTVTYISLLIYAAVLVGMGVSVAFAAKETGLSEPSSIFRYFCGEKIGNVFVVLLTVTLLLDTVMMAASAGANINETLGLSNWVGRLIVPAAVLTVCLGLDKILDVTSKIGPVIAAFIVLISIVAIVQCETTLADANAEIENLDVYTGSSNSFIGGIKYTVSAVFATVPIFAVIGMKSSDKKQTAVTSVVATMTLVVICFILVTAEIKNMALIHDKQIPNIELIAIYVPALRVLFSVVLLICGYSSMTLMFWTIVRKLGEEGTKRYYIITIVLGAVIYFASGLMEFSQIMNVVVNVGFWMGLLFVATVVIKDVRIISGKNKAEKERQNGIQKL